MLIVLPSVAVDELHQPMALTIGNGWQLYLGSLLCIVPLTLLQMLVGLVAYIYQARYSLTQIGWGIFLHPGTSAGDGISVILYGLETAVLVAFYSYAFRELGGTTNAQGSPPQPQAAVA
jgi:hypothetical protein